MFRRHRLPLRITLLLWLVLIITALNAVRLTTAISWMTTLRSYLSSAEVLYVAASGGIWTLAGLLLMWSFLRGGRGTGLLFLAAAGCYTAWVWADRILVQAGPPGNWRFIMLENAVLVAYTAAIVLDPRNQTYFRKETHDRKPKTPSSP